MPQLPGGQFDPSQYNDMRDFSPVPPGKYIAKLITSELKRTKDDTGEMLVLNFEIAAGEYLGKSFISRLNLVNASTTTVRMANEELATLNRACNLGPITNSEQLHNIAIIATLKLIPAADGYGPQNAPTKYESAAGLTQPPVNPEPDEATLAIMSGSPTQSPTGPVPSEVVPTPPPGFAPNPPPTIAETQQAAPVAPTQPAAPVTPIAAVPNVAVAPTAPTPPVAPVAAAPNIQPAAVAPAAASPSNPTAIPPW